jgi:hypothetical protein
MMDCPYCHASMAVPKELRQVSDAGQWDTIIFDNFTSNENGWLVGSQPSNYFTALNRFITEGRYRWEARAAIPNSITPAWLIGYSVSDFHLIVNCKHILGNRAGSTWGVVFRVQDNDNYYWFGITDTQMFTVALTEKGEWQDIVAWTRSNAIKPNGVNQLEIIAVGTHFTILINGRIVAEADDDHYSRGVVGLAVEGYTVGEDITFDFMDLTLRAP